MNSGGPYGVGLSVKNVAVPYDKTVTIVWGVLNSGNQTSQQLNDSIAALLKAGIKPVVDPGGGAGTGNGAGGQDTNFLRDFINSLITLGVGFFGANCDGPVVAARIGYSGQTLDQKTDNDTKSFSYQHTNDGKNDFGDYPFGCRDSSYTSTITITRQPRAPVE